MKKNYSAPTINFEEYHLSTQIAGACKDAGKTPVLNASSVTLTSKTVHCVQWPSGETKNCSQKQHNYTIGIDATIFADGSANAHGCTTDIYTESDYVNFIQTAIGDQGTIVNVSDTQVYFAFNGTSAEHTGTFEGAEYNNYFRS